LSSLGLLANNIKNAETSYFVKVYRAIHPNSLTFYYLEYMCGKKIL